MNDKLSLIFDTSDFPPRWRCGNWTPTHGWVHIISDYAIAGAYAAIPLALTYFIIQKKGMPFAPIFWLFVAFIFFCGLGHFIEGTIFWHPWYRFAAVIKVCTAVASWATVFALLPVLPKALALPGLAAINQKLENEVAERKKAESDLKHSYEELQVFTRTVLDREDRIIDLKKEVNKLLIDAGRPPRYNTEDSI